MPRQVEGPWFRVSKGFWYATLAGKNVSLRVGGESNRAEAVRAWHRLMAGGRQPLPELKPTPEPTPAVEPKRVLTVREVVEAFLAVKAGAVKDQTHVVYSCLLRHATDAFGGRPADRLKGAEVSKWLSTLGVGQNTRHDIGGTLASAFRWAEGEGLVTGFPLKGLKRPPRVSRGSKVLVTPEVQAKLASVAHPALRLLLTLLHETGARPSELTRLTAGDLDFGSGVATLSEHKTAQHTGKVRLIVLTGKALELLVTQAASHPAGPLLRNSRGNPWTKDAIGHAMRRASRAAGVKAIAYGLRHSFATAALTNGVPDAYLFTLKHLPQ